MAAVLHTGTLPKEEAREEEDATKAETHEKTAAAAQPAAKTLGAAHAVLQHLRLNAAAYILGFILKVRARLRAAARDIRFPA